MIMCWQVSGPVRWTVGPGDRSTWDLKTTLSGDFNYFDDKTVLSESRLVNCCINISSSTKPSIVRRLSSPSRAIRAALLLSCLEKLSPADLFLLLLPATFITLIWFATLMFPVTTVLTDCWKLMLSADNGLGFINRDDVRRA